MTLVLNEEQQILKDSAHDFLQERGPVSQLRELRDSGGMDGFSADLWAEMAEMGWSAILIPEEYGGLDFGYIGMGVILEETGRTLTSSPLLSTATIGVAAIAKFGTRAQCDSILPAVANGGHLLSLACDESAHHAPWSVNVEAVETSEGFRISGRKTAIYDGHVADTLIVSTRTGDDITLFLVPTDTPGVTVEAYPVLDTHIAANISFEQVEVSKDQILGTQNQGGALLEVILDIGRIGSAAEMLGIAQEAFERTMSYLKERKQFGVTIGSFQSLQHRAANLYVEIEMCKSLVIHALQELDDKSGDNKKLASLTKAKLCETAHRVTTEAIQMHGGIGMTDEFDIGFFLKRCQMLENLYGDRYYHIDRFATERGY